MSLLRLRIRVSLNCNIFTRPSINTTRSLILPAIVQSSSLDARFLHHMLSHIFPCLSSFHNYTLWYTRRDSLAHMHGRTKRFRLARCSQPEDHQSHPKICNSNTDKKSMIKPSKLFTKPTIAPSTKMKLETFAVKQNKLMCHNICSYLFYDKTGEWCIMYNSYYTSDNEWVICVMRFLNNRLLNSVLNLFDQLQLRFIRILWIVFLIMVEWRRIGELYVDRPWIRWLYFLRECRLLFSLIVLLKTLWTSIAFLLIIYKLRTLQTPLFRSKNVQTWRGVIVGPYNFEHVTGDITVTLSSCII